MKELEDERKITDLSERELEILTFIKSIREAVNGLDYIIFHTKEEVKE